MGRDSGSTIPSQMVPHVFRHSRGALGRPNPRVSPPTHLLQTESHSHTACHASLSAHTYTLPRPTHRLLAHHLARSGTWLPQARWLAGWLAGSWPDMPKLGFPTLIIIKYQYLLFLYRDLRAP
jgi:hypothetical protein